MGLMVCRDDKVQVKGFVVVAFCLCWGLRVLGFWVLGIGMVYGSGV